VPTLFEGHNDMFTLAMQVEKDRSLTSLFDIEQLEKERMHS